MFQSYVSDPVGAASVARLSNLSFNHKRENKRISSAAHRKEILFS